MKLTFEAMQILMEELQQNEMCAIYLMGLGKDITEKVTKTDLTNIIRVLCKNLKWIEVNPDSNQINKHENTNQNRISCIAMYRFFDRLIRSTSHTLYQQMLQGLRRLKGDRCRI